MHLKKWIVLVTNPNRNAPQQSELKQKKNRGFKTASDGRLVIKDLSDSDDNAGGKTDNDDDEDDFDDALSSADTLPLSNRKRKSDAASLKSSASATSRLPMKYQAGGSGIHR